MTLPRKQISLQVVLSSALYPLINLLFHSGVYRSMWHWRQYLSNTHNDTHLKNSHMGDAWGVQRNYILFQSWSQSGHIISECFCTVYTLPQRSSGPSGPLYPHTRKITFAVLLVSWVWKKPQYLFSKIFLFKYVGKDSGYIFCNRNELSNVDDNQPLSLKKPVS